jgi:hypothetical protein
MHRVAVDEQHAAGEAVARAPERVRVVPLLGLRVEDEIELHAVAALEVVCSLLDASGGEAGDDRHLVEPGLREVAERDVEDRPLAVDGEQGLREVRRIRAEALARAGRQHHPDHPHARFLTAKDRRD